VLPPGSVAAWVGPELVARQGLATSGGGAVGVDVGRQAGVAGRLSFRPPRSTSFGPATRLTEVGAELAGWARVGPIAARGGFALAGRRYALDTDTVAAHVAPQAAAGVSAPLTLGAWRLEVGVTAELDLARTRIGWSDADTVLAPAAMRVDLRLGAAQKSDHQIEPGADASTSDSAPERKR
jgi:hypothetical protein